MHKGAQRWAACFSCHTNRAAWSYLRSFPPQRVPSAQLEKRENQTGQGLENDRSHWPHVCNIYVACQAISWDNTSANTFVDPNIPQQSHSDWSIWLGIVQQTGNDKTVTVSCNSQLFYWWFCQFPPFFEHVHLFKNGLWQYVVQFPLVRWG